MIVLCDSSEEKDGLARGREGRKGNVRKHCNKMLYMNQGLTSNVIKWKSNSYNIKAFGIKELQAKMGYCNKSAENWMQGSEKRS